MKLIDVRETQSGTVADVLEDGAVLPHSIPLAEYCDPNWETRADDLRSVMGIIAQTEEALGTRTIISGGEVFELDGHLMSSYDERYEEGMPF